MEKITNLGIVKPSAAPQHSLSGGVIAVVLAKDRGRCHVSVSRPTLIGRPSAATIKLHVGEHDQHCGLH